jgi:hypothetical protein
VAVLGGPLFGIVFGPTWRDAGVMAGLLAPWFLAALTVSPLARIVVVYQGQGSKLIYDVASVIAVFGGILGAFRAGLGWEAAILAFALLQTVAYAIYLGVLIRLIRRAVIAPDPQSAAEVVD